MATTVRPVDELDHELVSRLRVDGRESNRSLAAALGVGEATVAARLRRLATDGVMRVVAVADTHAFGLGCLAVVLIRVGDRTPHEVAAALARIPAVTGVVVCSGRYAVVANVMAADTRELATVIADGVTCVPGVVSVQCEIVVDTLRFDSRWSGGSGLDQADPLPVPAFGELYDPVDVALVTALQRDARVSNRRIAADLGVSEATVRSRLRRLEDNGCVRIQAICDVESFGIAAHGFATIRAAPGRMQEAADALLDAIELGFVGRTIGSADFVAFAACESRGRLLSLVMHDVAGNDAIAEVELYEGCGTYKHTYSWSRLGVDGGRV